MLVHAGPACLRFQFLVGSLHFHFTRHNERPYWFISLNLNLPITIHITVHITVFIHLLTTSITNLLTTSITNLVRRKPYPVIHSQSAILPARQSHLHHYIQSIVHGDKRILLIGGKVVPFALARIPQNGEVRGNLAAGGVGVAQELTARDLEIAETLAPILYQRGLLLVGLDVIGHYLTEVNVTSPTCFQEITQQKGFNVAGMFIDALESAI